MHTTKTIFLIFICAALLCACGNKGPLYLPDGNSAVKPASSVDDETETEKEKKDREDSAPR
jgi:predicted small lipoprotein YifL